MQKVNYFKGDQLSSGLQSTHPLLNPGHVFLVRLNTNQNLQQQIELGEISIDFETQESLMLVKDNSNKRWSLKMNFQSMPQDQLARAGYLNETLMKCASEETYMEVDSTIKDDENGLTALESSQKHLAREMLAMQSQAFITEDSRTGQTEKQMLSINQRINCVPRNYKVTNEQRQGFFQQDQVLVQTVNPKDPYEMNQTYIYQLRKDLTNQSFDSDDDSEFTKKKKVGNNNRGGPIRVEPKPKRVTMQPSELQDCLFRLFQKRQEYRIQEIQDILNHPKNTLKDTLKSLCDYDAKKRVYTLRSEYK
ncbi:UNKNOWN [Stylonychia lemnae]|uniref:TFIIF beta subunit HTH domain-containing protein n=1 Tax=Stylonychia lemnae TaxID=5949 RepID=A0A078AZI3_STYLE|nr:UNKNOWN [Stylonychia lemnae]|eukprot:CDW86218.1 UNKNOWN [Stylonychia lemnae]